MPISTTIYMCIYTHILTHIYVLSPPGTASGPEPIYSACYDLPTTEMPDKNDSSKLSLAPWPV